MRLSLALLLLATININIDNAYTLPAAAAGSPKSAHSAQDGQSKSQPAKPVKAAHEKKPQPFRDKWAVLVGVGRYQDSNLGSIKYAGRNVLNLTRAFCDPDVGRFLPDHVLIATEGKATRESIAQAIYQDWLIKKALPADLLVVYLCMRACPSDDGSDILLFGSDASMERKEATSLSLNGLLGELKRRSQSKNILCLLDLSPVQASACPPGLLKKIAESTETTIFTADESLLQSNDDPVASSSYFVEYLGEGLKAGAGNLPIETVLGFVSESVAAPAPANLKPGAKPQRPALYSNPHTELLKLALGQTVKPAGFDPSTVHIGHPLDKLALTNPELAAAGRRMEAMPVPSTQSKIQDMINKEKEQDQDDDEDDGGDVDFAPYMAGMKKSIQAKWTPPKGFDEKKVVAVFSIQRDGTITQPEIVESSGSQEIDQSALKALKDASPLVPLPKGAPKHVQIRYQFDWHVNK